MNFIKSKNVPFALKMMRLFFKVGSALCAQCMANYAFKLWVTPVKSRIPEAETIAAKNAKKDFISIDGLKIRTWSWGEGPTVLFIHGWGGRGTQASSYISELNKAGYKVISFDFPAHGESEGERTNAFGIAKALTKVIEPIDDLQGVITHSFAGIVFGYYYQPTLALHKVVMVSPPAELYTPFNQFADVLQLSEKVKQKLLVKIEEFFGNDVFQKVSLINNVQKITQPVLVVHDTQDDVVPVADGVEVAKYANNSQIIQTTGLGHIKILFDLDTIKKVTDFIKQ